MAARGGNAGETTQHLNPSGDPDILPRLVFENDALETYSLSMAGHKLKKYADATTIEGVELRAVFHALLQEVTQQLDRCKCPHTLWMGSLLGAYRHHGVIPWDVDVDLLIENDSLEPLIECLQRDIGNSSGSSSTIWIVRNGFDNPSPGGRNSVLPIKVADTSNGHYLDIFTCFANEVKAGKCAYLEFCPDWFPTTKSPSSCLPKLYSLDELFPPRPCMFDGLRVWCANNAEKILYQTFVDDGLGWRSDEGLGVPANHLQDMEDLKDVEEDGEDTMTGSGKNGGGQQHAQLFEGIEWAP